MSDLNFTLNYVSGAAMTGIIWLIQLVHYPLFHRSERTPDFFKANADRTGWVVVPLMITEFVTGLLMVTFLTAVPLSEWLNILNFALIGGTWVTTAIFSVPCHRALMTTGYDPAIVDRLVKTNWIRTALWTARCVMMTVAWASTP